MRRGSLKIDLALPGTLEGLSPRILRELNDRFDRIGEALSEIEGIGGRTPKRSNNVDMQGNRVRNAADAREDGDYITRREAKKYAGYSTDGNHAFDTIEVKTIKVSGKIKPTPSGGGGSPVVATDDTNAQRLAWLLS